MTYVILIKTKTVSHHAECDCIEIKLAKPVLFSVKYLELTGMKSRNVSCKGDTHKHIESATGSTHAVVILCDTTQEARGANQPGVDEKFPEGLISQVHAMSGQVQPSPSLIDRDNLGLSHAASGHDMEVHLGIVVLLIALCLCRQSCQSH